jgi:carbonic anhydrase/acetyltransferase-like protein (isoleucine patch superfamily)
VKLIGRAFIRLHALAVRTSAKTFSVLASGAFASFGRGTVLEPPIRLGGVERIALGADVWVGGGSWLQVLDGPDTDVALSLGDGTNLAGGCVLSAAASVTLGRSVLLARNVYVSDHSHAFEDLAKPVIAQGITGIAPVEIGDGAWLGENVVVCPGVRIGRGAVIGANSVVLDDVPDHAVAVGAPARVVRRLADDLAPVQ